MARELFGDVINPAIRVGTKKWYTVPLSVATHVIVLGALVVIPLLATDMLPTPQSVMAFVAMPPPPPPPAAPTPPVPVQQVNPNAAPVEAPKEIRAEPPPQNYSVGVVGGVAGGIPGGVMGSVVQGIPAPPPPPQAPVRVGGDIKEPKKIVDAKPVYPEIAQRAKISGIVIIEATIGRDGSVRDAKVLRSQPFLDQAALDAVRKWRFTPTLLNGVPVEVIMTVTVNFTFSG